MVNDIKYNNSETEDIESEFQIKNSVLIGGEGATHTYAASGWFKSDRNLFIRLTSSSYSNFTKMKIEAIYGIKY